jgi:hypothetical protein
MSIHKEIHLEDEICADLTAAGWLYDAEDAGRYDRTQALFVDDAVAWIKASQPKAWEASRRATVPPRPRWWPSACARRWTARARWRCCARASR